MIAGAGVLTVFLAQSHSEDVGARLCKTAQNITQSGVSVTDCKYWSQRHRLFSKWDLGIKMDQTAWFSVTPEAIAEHHANRCASAFHPRIFPAIGGKVLTILDACCGVGGNAIQFALKGLKVIAYDNRIETLLMAYHNSRLYKVDKIIDFACADLVKQLSRTQVDIVFLSPPWGGPSYMNRSLQLSDLRISNLNGIQLLEHALQISQNVAYYLPRNINLDALVDIGVSFEVEKNFLNGKLKAITVYFGSLCNNSTIN